MGFLLNGVVDDSVKLRLIAQKIDTNTGLSSSEAFLMPAAGAAVSTLKDKLNMPKTGTGTDGKFAMLQPLDSVYRFKFGIITGHGSAYDFGISLVLVNI